MLRPARPRPIWSTVAICLAATSGWLNAVWIVAKTKIRSVSASRPCRERNRVEHALVKVRLAAVADPAGDREHEIDPDLVGEPAEAKVVVPGRLPAILDLRHGHSGRAVRREQAELEIGAVEQDFATGSPSSYQSAGKAAHAAVVHEERGSIGHGGGDDAADEDDVVAPVVLGVHRRTRSWRPTPVEHRRPDEPRADRRGRRTSRRPCGRTARRGPPGRQRARGGEPGRLEPDVEAARAAVDAPEHEGRLLRDRREAHHHEARHRGRPACAAVTTTTPVAQAPVAARIVSTSTEGSARPLIHGILTCHQGGCQDLEPPGDGGRAAGGYSATGCGATPRPVRAPAPQRAANATAS